MKKQEILRYVRDKANSHENKTKDLSLEDVEIVIQALKDCMLHCIKNCEEFVFHNFIKVESRVYKPKNRRNPKIGQDVECSERIKTNVKFCYSIRELVKTLPLPKTKKK